MPGFAEYYPVQCLLEISKRHRDAVDLARSRNGEVIGQDNFDNLMVSTVFAAIAIEASLNDYVFSHCLFLQDEYFQKAFRGITKRFLRSSIHNKIKLLLDCWSDGFPKELIKDVRHLIKIRNDITHQTGEFMTLSDTAERRSSMTNFRLDRADLSHMLEHHKIAYDFLSLFWLPGNGQIQAGGDGPCQDDAENPPAAN
jgi:hypothetical protein